MEEKAKIRPDVNINQVEPLKTMALGHIGLYMSRLLDLLDGSVHRRHYDQFVNNEDSSNEPTNAGRTDTVVRLFPTSTY